MSYEDFQARSRPVSQTFTKHSTGAVWPKKPISGVGTCRLQDLSEDSARRVSHVPTTRVKYGRGGRRDTPRTVSR